MKASPVRRILGPSKICYDCDHELYPNGKILFDDEFAKQDRKGQWHCSDCQLTDIRKSLLKMYGPNHEKTKWFMQQEDKKIRAWNQTALKYGTGPYRKNKYTDNTLF
jgi:hypothetical protein